MQPSDGRPGGRLLAFRGATGLRRLVIAALVVGASIIAHVGASWNGWRLLGYPGIAVTGFLLASALGVHLAVLALIPARRPAVEEHASPPRPK